MAGAVVAGRVAAGVSRRLGLGAGSVVAGRVALAVTPGVLAGLAAGRTSVVVTGTNGKTTTSHLVAAALGGRGAIAHNSAGSNMADGAVAALIAARRARLAVLEVDELHLGEVVDALAPDVLVLLNLSRDQLDRVSEVRATAAGIRALLARHPATVVVANADDPLVVWAAATAARTIWVAGQARWQGDSLSCPACGHQLTRDDGPGSARGPGWWCGGCGLARPAAHWSWNVEAGRAVVCGPTRPPVELSLGLPGRVNIGNAAFALAAAAAIGTDPVAAAPLLARVAQVAGRYQTWPYRGRLVRLLLVKNPAGWGEALDMLPAHRAAVLAVNAREADGRDVSWVWDLPVEVLAGRDVVCTGERAADVGVRLDYADIDHATETDPLAALDRVPAGAVDVLANYTAFLDLRRHLERGVAHPDPTPDLDIGCRADTGCAGAGDTISEAARAR